MNRSKAHEYMHNAYCAIQQWFLPHEDNTVVLELIDKAMSSDSLKQAQAYLRAALRLFGDENREGDLHYDEVTVVRLYIKDALAELQFQYQEVA